MGARLKRGSNTLLPLDALPSAHERRIRGPDSANHQETDRARPTFQPGEDWNIGVDTPETVDPEVASDLWIG